MSRPNTADRESAPGLSPGYHPRGLHTAGVGGVGRAALLQVVEIVRNAGATELLTSYTTGEGEPWPFYERLGFVPTGERDDAGEVILSLDLSRR